MKTMTRDRRSGVALVLVSISMVAMAVLGAALLSASSAARHQRLTFDTGNRAQYATESGQSYVYSRRARNIYYVPVGTFTLGSGDRFGLRSVRDGSNLVVTATGIANPDTPREAQRFVRFLLDYNPVVAIDNIFLWAEQLSAQGAGVIQGPGGVVVIFGTLDASQVRGGMDIQVTTVFIDGDALLNAAGTANLGSSSVPGDVYISGNLEMLGATPTLYGNIHVGGNLIIASGTITGNIYVHGDVEVRATGFTLVGDSRIYYAGALAPADTLPERIINVHPDELPPFLMPNTIAPQLREPRPAWYTDRGYETGTVPMVDDLRVYTDTDFVASINNSVSNVVIVSTGNIDVTVGGGGRFDGVLIAPYGSVVFKGTDFVGMVIADEWLTLESGSPSVVFRSITNYFANPDDYPVTLEEEF